MTKLAYLIGVSGSGKGYIAHRLQRLQEELQVVPCDCVRDMAARVLPRDENAPSDAWARWDWFLRTSDVASALSAVLWKHGPKLADARPVLAEGFDLGHDGFRGALRDALVLQGMTITDERVFWIDPAPEAVWEQRQRRARLRQSSESVETVRLHCRWYRERVSYELIQRHEDPQEVIRAIRNFLHA